jgi:hypothetical protein
MSMVQRFEKRCHRHLDFRCVSAVDRLNVLRGKSFGRYSLLLLGRCRVNCLHGKDCHALGSPEQSLLRASLHTLLRTILNVLG